MVLRSAAAAASADTRIHRASLDRLAAAQQPMPEPWPDDARHALSDLLLAGHRAIPVLGALDAMGIWTKVLPEWPAVPRKHPRNTSHPLTAARNRPAPAPTNHALRTPTTPHPT